ncbi:aromatic amino acid transaminase [Orrella sp. 11846]|uniref:amino acid aminotransferase n=1 Tax=Orrella sp. 11846 TaxID=3409913 RepID=UPI003B5CCE2A
MSNLFAQVALAPRDPILGLTEQFNTDTRPNKINLGVGVYYDDEGRIPLLRCVHQVEMARVQAQLAHGYLPIEGLASLNQGVQKLLLGADHPALAQSCAVTVQSIGGTGALKIGADFLATLKPGAKVAISNPSWENHRALFEAAGFEVVEYPYYDPNTRGLDIEGMLKALRELPDQSIVILHACCHNPTGVDPTTDQWALIADICKEKQLIPFMDIAYQGFGTGLQEDAHAVRLFVEKGLNCFVSTSFSKSFSLYGERIGALTILTESEQEAKRVLSQVKRVIRTNYSNPPTFGAAVVGEVLNSPELFAMWDEELGQMRERIKLMRSSLVEKLAENGIDQDFSFVLRQNGMFSFSGLTADQVDQLREEHAIYALSTGRICVAALNSRNIDIVSDAIAQVLKAQ